MKNYPFVKCLEPKKIRNPYTGEPMIVPCGHCMACNLHKADCMTLKCKLEAQSHNYTMFVTLTYSNTYIPRMKAFKEPYGYVFKDNTYRFRKYKDLYRQKLMDSKMSESDFKTMQTKVQAVDLPYLCKKDCQLFIKRLRKNLSKYTDEKIRYYACGEYGPIHYRPHFHFEFWFDKDVTFQNFRQAVCESWKYGNFTVELSRGKSAKYVAQYINGHVNLPSCYKSSSTKPFNCHSARLGEAVLRSEKKAVYEAPYNDFIKRIVRLDDSVSEVVLWRSLESYYFPKCRGYYNESDRFRYFAYTCYATAYDWTLEVSPYRQAKRIVEHVKEHGFKHKVKEVQFLLDWLRSNQRFKTYRNKPQSYDFNEDSQQMFFNSIYHDLYISKHFLHFVCDRTDNQLFPYREEIDYKIKLIDKHYKDKELTSLNNELSLLNDMLEQDMYHDEEFVFGDGHSSSHIPFLKYNSNFNMDEFLTSPLPLMYHSDVLKRSEWSIKHKELNDMNDRFNSI